MLGTIRAEWLLMTICLPGTPPAPVGVLLLDRKANQLFFKLRADLHTGSEDVDLVWDQLAEELNLRVAEEGAVAVVDWLQTVWSNVFRVSDPHSIQTPDTFAALSALYEDYVEKTSIKGQNA
jgi:hypothetical protein